MQQEYSHFKPSTLDPKAFEDVVTNGLLCFRENGKESPRHDPATLFQAVAFMERLIVMQASAKRESPPRELSDEEFYTDDFARQVEFFTKEFQAAMVAALPVMKATHSITSELGLLASCFLNPLGSKHRALPMSRDAARAQVCEHALMLSLTYSELEWTQGMYDALVEWYPPALLLCNDKNIPPMCTPAVHTALMWAMSLDEKPKSRFLTMRDQFENMIKPSPEAASHFDLPHGFAP